ncbi:rhomboid family intramembrane serine protease [Streptomyces sp. APSN-46.1]|uniref:rhomboid family intramembrane serine protease n=1 Tax=Streptomyces sp. APSN-46.1 TaxID=2929049 RepID=UPI001FB3D120|nr:rhomboid family intramembrane serine protease [Streptomyces sp. APSN-46.1]MCJ1679254.1 rhomboid family intramembrane serine protease [Streptomyces sp. APSN-46.1]
MGYASPDTRSGSWTQADRAKAAGKLMLGWVGLLWVIEVLDLAAGHALDGFGIVARDPEGLSGILAAPFLHFGFDHLAGNSLPLLVLGFVAALSGIRRFLAVCGAIIVADGFAVWLISPAQSITAGASGLIFGLFGYLLVRGFLERRPLGVAVGIVMAAVWGTTVLGGILPTDPVVSWQAHLFGLLAGVAAAFLFRGRAETA